MAWPLSALTTYLANSLPAIKAADLNSIQDAIVKLYNGTLSTIGLVLDGTGGVSSTPVAGALTVSKTAQGSSVAAGVLSKDLVPYAWGYITYTTASPSIGRSVNVSSVAEDAAGAGFCNVTLSNAPPNANFVVVVTPNTSSGFGSADTLAAGAGPHFRACLKNAAGTANRLSFMFVVFAG